MTLINQVNILQKAIEQIDAFERTEKKRARGNGENKYNWGYADGLMFAKQILATAIIKGERLIDEELAR